MKKYFSLFRYEMKNIVRDPMNLYMCCFPFILLILSTVIFPLVFKSIGEQKQATLQVTMLVFLIIMLTLGTFFLSTLTALLLVENKDEHTFNTIAVTPVGVTGYLRFKMVYLYIMSVISSFIVLYGTKLIAADQYKVGGVSLFDHVGIAQIIAFAAVNGLFVSALSLFQSAFAQNKVEGFAFIKGTGIIALVPALLILDSLGKS